MNSRAAVLALLMLVVIVWQVPHTIVLRYGLLVILGLICWPVAFAALARPATPLVRRARTPFAVFGAFVLWTLFVALVVSPSPLASLKALRGEWLQATLVLLIGYGLALRYGENHAAVRAVFLALVLHAFMQLVSGLETVVRGQTFPIMNFGGISDHKANVTYTNTLALAMLVADTASRARGGKGFLGIDVRWALAAFALLIASTVLATTRNGLIVFGLLTLAGFVLVAMSLRPQRSRAAWSVLIACVVVTLVGAVAGLKADTRWSTFMATVPVAWDTQKNRQWLLGERNETNLPLTAAGKRVDPSAYYRISYLKEGVRLLFEQPLGMGIGRDAFRRAIHAKYGTAGMSHAHNGYLDLAMSVGTPGLVLWLGFLAALVVFAARAGEAAGTGLRMALALVVASFAARTMLDATLRDHIIEEFMLVAGLLAGAIALDPGPSLQEKRPG
ncbi:MAG: O-antigen ligase family protein [Burkholderiales bacterium]|nr:O-antigen ligase family protein [Burkholderiales bacterium]